MTDAEALALAIEAAAHWGGCPAPRLIKNRENAVFEVALPASRAALRLHRPGYQTAAAIRSELWWQEALAAKGQRVPLPLRSATGGLVVGLSDGRLASVISWVGGAAIGEANVPLSGNRTRQTALHRTLGQSIAKLHDATDSLSLPPDFTRPKWDINGLLGETPFWDRFWDHPGLTHSEAARLSAARDHARQILQAYAPQADIGLIHADVLRENVLEDGGKITLIDFDDSGFGFRLYDLGTALSQNLSEPNLPQIAAALIAGYSEIRPLRAIDIAQIPLFTLLRCLASVGWTISRLPHDAPVVRTYITRATRAAEMVLTGAALLG